MTEIFELGHVDNLTDGLKSLEQGNIGLSDGSVQQTTTPRLRRALEAAKADNEQRAGKTRIQLPEPGSSSSE